MNVSGNGSWGRQVVWGDVEMKLCHTLRILCYEVVLNSVIGVGLGCSDSRFIAVFN